MFYKSGRNMRILALSGFVPEQICDVVRFTGYAGDRNIAHYCPYASDFISQVYGDQDIDGAVFPRTCDSSRIMKSYLEASGKFLYQLPVPVGCDDLAVEYFSGEIRAYKEALERFFNVALDGIPERINWVNRRNRTIRQAYEQLEKISFAEYICTLHKMLKLPLEKQKMPDRFKICSEKGKRIYLVGSFFSDSGIAEIIENSGLKVVGDNLPESGRLAYALQANSGGDPYKEVARSILSRRLSPSQNNFREILRMDMEEIEKKEVQGVIVVTQKYCEPYDYLCHVYKKALNYKGIPLLKISLSGAEDRRKTALAIEAFSEMIS